MLERSEFMKAPHKKAPTKDFPDHLERADPDEADQRVETVAPGGISDQPTKTLKEDALGFAPYVEALANFLMDSSTLPPLTISIEGEWGSGKSSFMLMLATLLKEKGERTVAFNAWRHDKADSLWSAFALQLNGALANAMPLPQRFWAALSLFRRRFRFAEGWFDLIRMAALAILFAAGAYAVWILSTRYGPDAAKALIHSVDESAATPTPAATASPMTASESATPQAHLILSAKIAGIMAALSVVVTFLAQFKKLFGNPFSIDLARYARSPRYEDQISFIEQFHDDFAKIVGAYIPKKGQKVFVFIDDLDRCEIPKAADLIQGLNLLTSDIENFVFIIGMDREKVAAALAIKFEKALPYIAPRLTGIGGSGNTKGGLAFGYNFIEKFVQIAFRVPRPTGEMERFLQSLSGDPAHSTARDTPSGATDEQRGIAVELSNDSDRVREIASAIAGTFNFNPRRLKQFVNLFRLQAFIADRTGLFRGSEPLTFEQLGKFVALGLRWPLLMSELARSPSLLGELERRAIELAPTVKPAVDENEESEKRREADAPFKQWTDTRDLQTFLCIEMSAPKIIDRAWSFQGMDVMKLLRVSPPIPKPVETGDAIPGVPPNKPERFFGEKEAYSVRK